MNKKEIKSAVEAILAKLKQEGVIKSHSEVEVTMDEASAESQADRDNENRHED